MSGSDAFDNTVMTAYKPRLPHAHINRTAARKSRRNVTESRVGIY